MSAFTLDVAWVECPLHEPAPILDAAQLQKGANSTINLDANASLHAAVRLSDQQRANTDVRPLIFSKRDCDIRESQFCCFVPQCFLAK